MLTINSTDVRKDWSAVYDSVVREKPQFVKRTRDMIVLSNLEIMTIILEKYDFEADYYIEPDGSLTLSLKEIDIAVNGEDMNDAKSKLASDIKEYAEEYYKEFSLYSNAMNRKDHLPYVMKALILDDVLKIEEKIVCQAGKS